MVPQNPVMLQRGEKGKKGEKKKKGKEKEKKKRKEKKRAERERERESTDYILPGGSLSFYSPHVKTPLNNG